MCTGFDYFDAYGIVSHMMGVNGRACNAVMDHGQYRIAHRYVLHVTVTDNLMHLKSLGVCLLLMSPIAPPAMQVMPIMDMLEPVDPEC